MIRALLVSNLYPSSRWPTRGTFNLNGFRALARMEEVQLVAPTPWWSRWRQPAEWFRVPRESGTGIEASFPTFWSVPGLSRVHARAMHASLRAHVRDLRRDFPFDIILAAFAYPDGVAAARLAREFDCPVAMMVLGSDLNEVARNPALRPQIRWALEQCGRVVTVSAALRERVLELGIPPERIVVQHNGVDGERFALRDRYQVRARLGLPLEANLITYVGNLVDEKGPDLLVEALGLLAGKAGNFHLCLVGGGDLEPSLRQRVRQLGIERQVQFLGRRPNGEVPDWISASDTLCLPSRREGCPNVVLEALASGRPVVAARVGGVPELLDHGNGILVAPEDPAALAAGLADALERPWDPAALRSTVPCLSWEQFGRTLHDVLEASLVEWNASRSPGLARFIASRP